MPDQQSIPEVLADLKDLTVSYAKQETIEPLKALKRFLMLGFPGALLLAIGVVELTLFLLRVLQTHSGSKLTGSLSWIPYVAAVAFDALVALVFVMVITRKPKETSR